MPNQLPGRALAIALALLAACGRPQTPGVPVPVGGPKATPGPFAGLPPVPTIRGPLALSVVYPESTAVVTVEDSSFIFGATGTGDATLSINGHPVSVAPNGAWIAWLAFPRDSLMHFLLEARTATDSARLDYVVRRSPRFTPPMSGLWVDPTSMTPVGRAWWPGDEGLVLSVRAAEGADVSLRLPDGRRIPFQSTSAVAEVPDGIRAFDRDTMNLARPFRADRYSAIVRGLSFGGDPGPILGGAAGPGTVAAVLEIARGADTIRTRWPLRLAPLDSLRPGAELDDDVRHNGGTDGITVGRAAPGATYQWFFPAGTRAQVDGRLNGELRLRLSSGQRAWVSAGEARPIPAAAVAMPAVVGSVTTSPRADRAVIRIPVSRRVPFQVVEEERRLIVRLYHATGDVNWIRYGAGASPVRALAWDQPAADLVTLTIDLAQPLWGYRATWSRNDLLLEVRQPPVIDPSAPLRGRLIVVDAGHPPGGATGPTGYWEPQATLAVAVALRDRLVAEGARVIMTRTDMHPVDLGHRPAFADSVGADLLVSIHNNALPDGVNPFTNNGTSVFYFQPRSIPLARAVDEELVARFGIRDLGIGRGDLALVRPTWMPSILTEGLFMMMPEQEAALRTPDGQDRYADGVLAGIRRFLAGRARVAP